MPERSLQIADVTAELGTDWVLDRVVAVHGADRQLLTRDGELVDFDYLLREAGVSSHRTLHQGEVWQRGNDPRFLDRIIDDALAGEIKSIAIVIPRGARWPVPAGVHLQTGVEVVDEPRDWPPRLRVLRSRRGIQGPG